MAFFVSPRFDNLVDESSTRSENFKNLVQACFSEIQLRIFLLAEYSRMGIEEKSRQ